MSLNFLFQICSYLAKDKTPKSEKAGTCKKSSKLCDNVFVLFLTQLNYRSGKLFLLQW